MGTQTPMVHGNGFIVLPLFNNTRLHVWHKDIPRQQTYTGIHDHRFSFVSRVICGELLVYEYDIKPVEPGETDLPGVYDVYQVKPRNKEDTELVRSGGQVAVSPVSSRVVSAGGTMYLGWGMFHEVRAASRKAATIMTKVEVMPSHTPRVLCPVGRSPDNDFDRYAFDNDKLYGLINDVLHGVKDLNMYKKIGLGAIPSTTSK